MAKWHSVKDKEPPKDRPVLAWSDMEAALMDDEKWLYEPPTVKWSDQAQTWLTCDGWELLSFDYWREPIKPPKQG